MQMGCTLLGANHYLNPKSSQVCLSLKRPPRALPILLLISLNQNFLFFIIWVVTKSDNIRITYTWCDDDNQITTWFFSQTIPTHFFSSCKLKHSARG